MKGDLPEQVRQAKLLQVLTLRLFSQNLGSPDSGVQKSDSLTAYKSPHCEKAVQVVDRERPFVGKCKIKNSCYREARFVQGNHLERSRVKVIPRDQVGQRNNKIKKKLRKGTTFLILNFVFSSLLKCIYFYFLERRSLNVCPANALHSPTAFTSDAKQKLLHLHIRCLSLSIFISPETEFFFL